MKVKKKIINIFAIVLCCKMLMLPAVPAHAFVWPVISPAAIAAFINDITTGISQITGAKAEIDNYTRTIHSVGDQVSAIAKYIADLQRSIENLRQAVERIVQSLVYTARNIDDLMSGLGDDAEDAEQEKSDIADKAVGTVEGQTGGTVVEEEEEEIIDDHEDGEDNGSEHHSEAIDASIINEFIEENVLQDKKVNESFNDTTKKIVELSKSGTNTLESLRTSLDNNSDIGKEEKENFISQIDTTQKQLNSIQKNALDLVASMKKDYNENGQKILKAYDEYKQAINNYNEGKINKEDLSVAGQKLKDTAKNSRSIAKYKDQLASISRQVSNFIENVQELGETITDGYANNKDYPNEAYLNLNNNGERYAFNFHQTTNHMHAKGCYANKSDDCRLFSLEGGDDSFLLSKEFTAKGKTTVRDSHGQCQKLTFDDLEEKNGQVHQDWFMAKLRDCVTRANTEKTYFWPEVGSEDELAPLNIFDGVTEPNFHNSEYSYEKKGVYRHIAEDYGAANIINANQTKQYARTWLGLKKDDPESTLNNLMRQLSKNISTTRDAYNMLALIELEYLKMLSRLRRVDAINRAKEAVDLYRPLTHLYIDGRDEDYLKANDNPSGGDIPIGSVKDKVCDKEVNGPCDDKIITVISNVFPYFCGYKGSESGAKAFSLKYDDKNIEGAMVEVEKAIKECMKIYVEQATNGTKDGQVKTNPDDIKREWRENEIRATTDSLFHTIALATINLYRSAKDYAYLNTPQEVNIASVDEDLRNAKTARDDYGACAKINHYGAQQILTIVDADAQGLQSEIMKEMLNISYDFFPKEDE